MKMVKFNKAGVDKYFFKNGTEERNLRVVTSLRQYKEHKKIIPL